MQKNVYVDLAIEVADSIKSSAIYHWDYITWLKYQRPIGYDLYDGCGGIALFFSSLYQQTGEQIYRKIALDILKPLYKSNFSFYHSSANKLANTIGIATGYPSFIYTFLLISHLLKEDFEQHIKYYLSLINREAIENDQTYDVMHGSAGTILSLLKLYEATNDAIAIEIAKIAGNHLVDWSQTEAFTGTKRPLTGFSHGAAGISYALGKLYAKTGEESYKHTAKKWLEYERSVYSEKHQNWPDFRKGIDEFTNSWCHGATGIGLARLGSLQNIPDEKMPYEIEHVLELITTSTYADVLHLCCGNFGRLEFLITYTEKFNQRKEVNVYNFLSGFVDVTNFKHQLHRDVQRNALSSGFFLGLAGIGYQFLRLHDAKSYPSILLFE